MNDIAEIPFEKSKTEYKLRTINGREVLLSAGRRVAPATGIAIVKELAVEQTGAIIVPTSARSTLDVRKGGRVQEHAGAHNVHYQVVAVAADPGYYHGSTWVPVDVRVGDRIVLGGVSGGYAPSYYPPGVAFVQLAHVIGVER